MLPGDSIASPRQSFEELNSSSRFIDPSDDCPCTKPVVCPWAGQLHPSLLFGASLNLRRYSEVCSGNHRTSITIAALVHQSQACPMMVSPPPVCFHELFFQCNTKYTYTSMQLHLLAKQLCMTRQYASFRAHDHSSSYWPKIMYGHSWICDTKPSKPRTAVSKLLCKETKVQVSGTLNDFAQQFCVSIHIHYM